MPIPPHRVAGDVGHITDHNDMVDVLTGHASSIATTDATVSAHVAGADPHGDRAYADTTKAAIAHTHSFPVSSVNGYTGVVVLAASDVGAETPTGAQAKVDALGATVIPLTQKGAVNGVATLDGTGKIPSAQLPAGAGVTSVNGMAGAVTLTAADVSAVPTTQKGAANGVATLDASTLVPVAQIPGLPGTQITSGTVDVARLPTGSTGTTVSLGNHTHTYPVSSVNSQTGAVVLAAADVGALATSARGAVNGVASLDASTLVPVAQIPNLDATKITSGTFATARIPSLAATYVTQTADNNPQVTSAASTKGFARVDLNYTVAGGTPDALAFYYGGAGGAGGTRSGSFNEYGELRARPANTSNVAFRALAHASGSSGNIFEVTDSGATTQYLRVSSSAAATSVPLSVTGAVTATGAVTGSNLPPSISSGTSLPSPAGYTDGAIFLVHA